MQGQLACPLPLRALVSLHSDQWASVGQLPGLGHMWLGSQCWASLEAGCGWNPSPPSKPSVLNPCTGDRETQVPISRGWWAPAPMEDTGQGGLLRVRPLLEGPRQWALPRLP